MTSPPPPGTPVADPSPGPPPRRQEMVGLHVALTPLSAERDAPDLYAASHGSPPAEAIWTYLPYGPFPDLAAMTDWLRAQEASADPLFFTVRSLAQGGRPVGLVSFLSVVPAMRRLELGHIWYAPPVQRTSVTTEAAYLLLREAFDHLGYRRVEWKCNDLNLRSRAAAERLGFRAEGLFRQHMIIRGHNRDTAWYAMLDGDWPAAKEKLERWLAAHPP